MVNRVAAPLRAWSRAKGRVVFRQIRNQSVPFSSAGRSQNMHCSKKYLFDFKKLLQRKIFPARVILVEARTLRQTRVKGDPFSKH